MSDDTSRPAPPPPAPFHLRHRTRPTELGDMDAATFRAQGPSARRVDRGLPRTQRSLSRTRAGEAGRNRGIASDSGAGRRRTVRSHPRRLRKADRPGPDALESPWVLRVFRDQRERARHSRGLPVVGAQSAGDAVAHVAIGHRARSGDRRMAARSDGTAVILRRRDLRHRVDLHAARARRRARDESARRADARIERTRRRPARTHLLLGACAQLRR